MSASVKRIISFWFELSNKDWFFPPEGLDKQLRDNFGPLVRQARNGELSSWSDEPQGSLALVLLLDQVPRNIFRGSGESFASDAQAVEVATHAVAKGFDRQSPLLHQLFFYMPFMHDERLLSQVTSLSLYDGLAARAAQDGSEESKLLGMSVGFAQRHKDAILKFGRFPARNEALGRESTEAEGEFLKENEAGI